ncbi:MAG: hypothetical protein HWD59_14260 [Coxiellaceae bacterium]|nr:MAG: hypothetical protein HWD59_14260 [Coxiellaceae bacterium]
MGDLLTALPQQSHLNLIIAADVFNYIGNLTDIFKAAYQALTEDGWFIFTVEKGSQFPYELQNSARYAHHQDYISQLAEQTGFKIESIELAQLRIQQNLPVEGYVILLSKPRAH